MPLKVSDGIAAYIDDFQKSDAPQFKGKSKKERRDMAIAAYLTAKRGGKSQEENVKSADRKPETYTKPDGKKGIRMIPVDKEVMKAESLDAKDKPTVKKIIKKLKGASQAHAGQAKDLEKAMKEETNFAVSIEGLPMMFMSADSPGMLKQTLRKIVKQPSMIKAVKRVTDAKVKKTFRLKAQGREEDEE